MSPKHSYGIKLLTPVQLFQFFQLASSPLLPASAPINVRPGRPIPGPFTENTTPSLRVCHSSCKHSLFYIRQAHDAGSPKIRILPKHGAKLLDGAVILPREVQNRAIVGGNDERKWIQLARSFALAQRLVEAPQPHQMLCIPMVGGSVVGVQFDGPPVFLF